MLMVGGSKAGGKTASVGAPGELGKAAVSRFTPHASEKTTGELKSIVLRVPTC